MDDAFPAPELVIPQRPPFLFLTAVLALEPGISASGYWKTTGDEEFFDGHFPARPTLPGVLQCESIAQLGAYTLLSELKLRGRLPLFGGIDSSRFRRQVMPGERLDLCVEIDRISARAGKGHGIARVEGIVTCECKLFFVLANPTD